VHENVVRPNAHIRGDQMSDLKAPLSQLTKDIGFTIHDVLRYGLTGTIAILLAAVALDDTQRKEFSDALTSIGSIGFLFLVLSAGASAYVLTRQTLLPIVWRIWLCKWNPIPYFTGRRWETRQEFFAREFNLGFADEDIAYFVLRTYRDGDNPLWSQDIQDQFYRQHSENHLLSATSLLFLIAAGWSYVADQGFVFFYLFLFGVFGIAAMGADIQLARREATYVRRINKEKLETILRDSGLLPPSQSQRTDTTIKAGD
jgi:hypothetical protein